MHNYPAPWSASRLRVPVQFTCWFGGETSQVVAVIVDDYAAFVCDNISDVGEEAYSANLTRWIGSVVQIKLSSILRLGEGGFTIPD